MIFLIGPRHCRAFTCALRGAHDSDCATGVARSDEGVFSGGPGWQDSWTPGPKPLCHRHRTGPHPSGLLWTPWTPGALAAAAAGLLAAAARAGAHAAEDAAVLH